MKLVIFTPAVVQSAIARVSVLVIHALRSGGHEITVVRAEDREWLDKPAFDFDTNTIRWDAERAVDDLVCRSDAVFYQIGDHYPFHRGCVEWLRQVPGVVCMHDYFLGDLFSAWSQNRRSEAVEILRQWYGDDAAAKFFSYRNGEALIEGTWRAAPLTEWIASMASGVIVHSGWDIDRVLKACPGPVYSVPLPYDLPAASEERAPDIPAFGDDFVILTVGHVNRNKRAQSVIRAIGESSLLRGKARYHLVGLIEADEAERLSALASELGVRLTISGEVTQQELRGAFARADVVACLRLPALESASASAIESMLSGKAVVVLDTGFYSELPEFCVRKVAVANEIAGLKSELEYLYENSQERIALGERAAEWARGVFSADRYASELVAMCASAAKAAPTIAASRYFAQVLANWGGKSEHLLLSEETLGPLAIFDKSLAK